MSKNELEITTTGKMREALANAMLAVSKGALPAADGKNLIGLSNQITGSFAIELKFKNIQTALGHENHVMGSLKLG